MKRISIILSFVATFGFFQTISPAIAEKSQITVERFKKQIQQNVDVVLDLFKQAGLEKPFQELILLEKQRFPFLNDPGYKALQNKLFDANVALCLKLEDSLISSQMSALEDQAAVLQKEAFTIFEAAKAAKRETAEAVHPELVKEYDFLKNKLGDIRKKSQEGSIEAKKAGEEAGPIIRKLREVAKKIENLTSQKDKEKTQEKINRLSGKAIQVDNQKVELVQEEVFEVNKISDELQSYKDSLYISKEQIDTSIKQRASEKLAQFVQIIKYELPKKNANLAKALKKQLKLIIQDTPVVYANCYQGMPGLEVETKLISRIAYDLYPPQID